MSELARVLDELVEDAPVERKSWDDVRARLRPRRRRRVSVAAAAAITFLFAGTAVAYEAIDRVQQQERAIDAMPDAPDRVGNAVEVVSGEDWSLAAWRTSEGVVCVTLIVVPGKSPFGCGFPVRGAKPGDHTIGTGPPTHAVAGSVSSGGLVGPDGKAVGIATVYGVAAADVAAVRVELANGRIVDASTYDAPPALDADVRFFIVRLHLPPTPLHGNPPVAAFLAYDARGRLIERFRL